MNPPGRCRINIFGRTPPPCAAPPAWRHPTGFAGVSYATVLGLVVGWLAVVEGTDAGVVKCVGMGVGSGWCPVPWAICRVVATPPARRYPSGFAGVFFATVLGLGVWWSVVAGVVDAGVVECVGHTSVRCRGRSCWPGCGLSWWPWSVLTGLTFRVFEVVVMFDGR